MEQVEHVTTLFDDEEAALLDQKRELDLLVIPRRNLRTGSTKVIKIPVIANPADNFSAQEHELSRCQASCRD